MGDRPLIAIFLSFLGGLLVGARFLPPYSLSALLVSFTALFLILVVWIISRNTGFQVILPGFFLLGTFLVLCEYHESDLLPWAEQGKPVIIEGVVLEPSRHLKDRVRLTLRADRILLKDRERRVNDRILVNIYREGRAFTPGEKLRFPARLRPFRNFGNPGHYDYEQAMRVRGVTCAASVSDGRRIVPMGTGETGFPRETLESIRRPVRELLRGSLPPDDRALYRALVLGERQDLSHRIREPFDRAGLGHILAVSGLHIGLIAWLVFTAAVFGLSRSYGLALRLPIRKAAAVLTCLPVVAYACIAGFQVSSQRAMMMALAFLLSVVLEKEQDVWSTLALAGLLILAMNPLAIFSISFQLSFFAVTGILWLTPVFYRRILRAEGSVESEKDLPSRFLAYAAGLFSVTLSATIFLLPLTVFYFHRISLVALPANLMVVPVLGLWVLPLGLLASLSLTISHPVAVFLVQMGGLGLEWIRGITGVLTQFSWSSTWVITPNGLELALLYGLFFFLFFAGRRYWAKAGLGLVLIFMSLDVVYWVYRTQFNAHVKVTILDVGQGNAALVELPDGKRMLIDGGGFPDGSFDTGRMVVAPFLLRQKIRKVDYMVLTHPQSDHMNGLRFLAAHFNPVEFWSNGDVVKTPAYRELMQILLSKKARIRSPPTFEKGMVVSGVKIAFLHPPAVSDRMSGSVQGLGINDRSLVMKLTYGDVSVLFPGDLEEAGEKSVVTREGPALKSDVLIAPHHGSRGSCTRAFLERVRPRFVIISCGRGNTFGFPHQDTIERIRDVKGRIIRTDQGGAVELTIAPDALKIRSFHGGKVFPD